MQTQKQISQQCIQAMIDALYQSGILQHQSSHIAVELNVKSDEEFAWLKLKTCKSHKGQSVKLSHEMIIDRGTVSFRIISETEDFQVRNCCRWYQYDKNDNARHIADMLTVELLDYMQNIMTCDHCITELPMVPRGDQISYDEYTKMVQERHFDFTSAYKHKPSPQNKCDPITIVQGFVINPDETEAVWAVKI